MQISRIWPFSLIQDAPQIDPVQFILNTNEMATAVSNTAFYHLRWRGAADQVRIYAGISTEQIDRSAPYVCVNQQKEAVVAGLNTAVPHIFELVFKGSELDGKRIKVAERFLPFTGASNFRDQGGYFTANGRQLRWQRLYRAGLLADMTDDDQALFSRLDIRFVCDIRSQSEAARRPDQFPQQLLYKQWPIESLDKKSQLYTSWIVMFQRHKLPALILNGYIQYIIEDSAAQIGRILHYLADPQHLPAVVHCSAGKDRTGVVMALLLSVLGVPDEVVVADYTLSNRYYMYVRELLRPDLRPLTRLGVSVDQLWPLLIVQAKTLRYTFHYIRSTYGSIENYLRNRAGIDTEIIDRLRENFLEPAT
jgi:protein-tyrosine phosphatase